MLSMFRRIYRGEEMDELLQRQVGHVDGDQTSLYDLQEVEDIRAVISSPMTRVAVSVTDWPGLDAA
jgi:hypothetical protein